MADVGPKIEPKALGDDFAAAEPDDLRPRCSFVLAIEHLEKISGGAFAKGIICPRHHGIIGQNSSAFSRKPYFGSRPIM
jgi:hypothetical protein